jgi:hypothetical protein
MSTTSSSGPEWTGDMLDKPEVVAAFAVQVRRNINSMAEFIAVIRRDAEAMWQANPPEGYGSFEAWWRHRWVRGPLREIQEHLEKAADLTHALEARYRRGRHDIPAARLAAAASKQGHPALRPGAAGRNGSSVVWEAQAEPYDAPHEDSAGTDFMDLVRERRRSA